MVDYAVVFTNFTGAFPDIVADNVSAPGAGDGTEFVKLMVDDVWGRAQAMMNYAGLTPDGVSEADGTAQILEALNKGWAIGPGMGVTYWKEGTPAANGDRVLLLQGQEVLIATYDLLFAEVYVGDGDNPTAPAFYATNGSGVRTLPGGGATHFILPDSRGLSLKNIGNATISARTKTGPVELGEVQEDQSQEHLHQTPVSQNRYTTGVLADGGLGSAGHVASNLVSVQYTDGASGTPRTGINTRDSAMGTNFGITY